MLAVLLKDCPLLDPLPPTSVTVVNCTERNDYRDLNGLEASNPAHDDKTIGSDNGNDGNDDLGVDNNDSNVNMEYEDEDIQEEENERKGDSDSSGKDHSDP